MKQLPGFIVLASCVASVAMSGQDRLSGKWQGATPSGQQILLDVTMKGEQLLGTLTIGGHTAEIRDGRVKAKTFSFNAAVEGADVTFNGQLAGDEIRLTPEGMGRTVTLKRAK